MSGVARRSLESLLMRKSCGMDRGGRDWDLAVLRGLSLINATVMSPMMSDRGRRIGRGCEVGIDDAFRGTA